MPLSRVIRVTHYIGFLFGSASFTELLCWCGTVLSALPQFTCRNSVALCRPCMVGREALRSFSFCKLLVPRENTSTMQRRAFSVLALYIENSFNSLADSIITK